MKKQLFGVFVSLCLLVSMLPTMAFAEAGVQDSDIVADVSDRCEHHPSHDKNRDYTRESADILCPYEQTENCVNANCPVCSVDGADLEQVCTGA